MKVLERCILGDTTPDTGDMSTGAALAGALDVSDILQTRAILLFTSYFINKMNAN